jgi:UDP-GlcNAc3NAcA epimerase
LKKKIITIVGARPQIIKSSAISRAISGVFKNDLEEIIVHTGQHYDENMSKVFFEEMMIPFPNYNLNVGSGSHGLQTAKMLEGLEDVFIKEQPNAVLVYGDTNSTIAGALSASKIHIPVIHVEAGLRSFNKAMPEEINRISCDHMSTMLFTPTQSGIDNLIREGFKIDISEKASIDHPHLYHCGDIMFDNSLHFSKISEDKSTIISDLNLEINGFVLCTVHRDSNTDIKENMESIFQALLDISENSGLKVILPLHPRTKAKMQTQLCEDLFSTINESEMIKVISPTGFLDIIALEKNARIIVTDSGGLQKESFFFQKPCVILRAQTEWIEIVENGNAILADCDYNRIINAFNSLLSREEFTYPKLYGDGQAADFICKKIVTQL